MSDLGGTATTSQEALNTLLGNYAGYLPSISGATTGSQIATDTALANASAGLTPTYSQIGLTNLQDYALPYAQVGQDVQRSNALAGAQTNLQQILGYGGLTALAADELQRAVNPEYYASRELTSQKLNELLNSVNLGGLSGGETAAVERSLNQQLGGSGNLGVQNAMNTVTNAMNFGDYLNTKRTALGNALNTASNFLTTAQNNQFNPVSVALSQPDTSTQSNWGTGQFQGVTRSGTQSYNLGSNLLGNMTGSTNTAQNNMWNASSTGSPIGVSNAVTSGIGNICCFIFMEAYNGQLPWWVRKCRDMYYKEEPIVALGYKRMARWFVPLMQRSSLVRWLVNITMIKPLTRFGGYICSVPGYEKGYRYLEFRDFWFAVWRHLGRKETR